MSKNRRWKQRTTEQPNPSEPVLARSVLAGSLVAGSLVAGSLVAASLLLAACGGIKGEAVEKGFGVEDRGNQSTDLAFSDEAFSNEEQADPFSNWNVTKLPADRPAPEAFEFAAVSLKSGDMVLGSDLYAQRPLIISFMVPTCAICAREAPKFSASADTNPGVSHVVVHSGATPGDYRAFIDDVGLSSDEVINLVEGDASLWSLFGIVQQPSYVLVDEEGTITSSLGSFEDAGLERAVAYVSGKS